MTKRQVIEKTLVETGGGGETAVAELERRLPDGEDIKTCEDFKHLNTGCCGFCHGSHAASEMEVVPLPEGGHAWVCCTVDFAIRPEFIQGAGLESNHDAEMLRVAPYPWFVKQRVQHMRRRRRRRTGL